MLLRPLFFRWRLPISAAAQFSWLGLCCWCLPSCWTSLMSLLSENQKSQLEIEKMLTPKSFPYEPSCSSHRRRVPREVSPEFSPRSAPYPPPPPCEDPVPRLPTHARLEIGGGACVAAPTGSSRTTATWRLFPGLPPAGRGRARQLRRPSLRGHSRPSGLSRLWAPAGLAPTPLPRPRAPAARASFLRSLAPARCQPAGPTGGPERPQHALPSSAP